AAITLDALRPKLQRELSCLKDMASTAAQLAHIERTLIALADRSPTDSRIASAVDQIASRTGLIELSNIAYSLGLSSRQLQRPFRDEVGIGPKLFSRIQRFQRVFWALENAAPDWVQVALDCGYFDQAHLIRDFHDFAGQPPAALLSPETDLAFHFLQAR